MGWFKKKEEVPEVPQLPALPQLPPVPTSDKKELPKFPPFPSQDSREKLSYAPEDNEVIVEPPQGGFRNDKSPIPELPPVPKNHERRTFELSPVMESRTKPAEPIFVRIDKFQAAQKNFGQIKDKVREVEVVLRRVKDTKEREDKEISSWVDDLEKIKSRLAEIDSNIFSKL